jgi:V/A-type H+-transporting ATPase subunit E
VFGGAAYCVRDRKYRPGQFWSGNTKIEVGDTMPYEQLIESVELCAEDKIRGIRDRANQDAENIKTETKGKDEIIKKRYLDAVKKTVESERRKSIAKINEDNHMRLIRAKDNVFKHAFTEAQKLLVSVRSQVNYETIFRKLLKETILELEGEEILLHIDKRDENLCKRLLTELKLNHEIMTDITCTGGLNASTRDGKFIIFNTIESRFERAKEQVKLEIFAILYGGQVGI